MGVRIKRFPDSAGRKHPQHMTTYDQHTSFWRAACTGFWFGGKTQAEPRRHKIYCLQRCRTKLSILLLFTHFIDTSHELSKNMREAKSLSVENHTEAPRFRVRILTDHGSLQDRPQERRKCPKYHVYKIPITAANLILSAAA